MQFIFLYKLWKFSYFLYQRNFRMIAYAVQAGSDYWSSKKVILKFIWFSVLKSDHCIYSSYTKGLKNAGYWLRVAKFHGCRFTHMPAVVMLVAGRD